MNKIGLEDEYAEFLNILTQKIWTARLHAMVSVNSELVRL